jgi:hypothetical protein
VVEVKEINYLFFLLHVEKKINDDIWETRDRNEGKRDKIRERIEKGR